MLNTLNGLTDFEYLCRLHMIIGSAGSIYGARKVRSDDVNVSGTKWRPQIPFEYDIRKEIAKILRIESVTERVITPMLLGMRRQIFDGGNKQTSMMFANKEMIANGCGIISVPTDHIEAFYDLLIKFYETNDMVEIKNFVYESCIDGPVWAKKLIHIGRI